MKNIIPVVNPALVKPFLQMICVSYLLFKRCSVVDGEFQRTKRSATPDVCVAYDN